MIEWAVVGQQVICIKDDWLLIKDSVIVPRKDQILTIRKVVEFNRYPNEIYLRFE